MPAHAKKPRTKTEEASGSSYCRAKEAVGYLQHHAASGPAIDAATPGAAASNGTASRAACIKDKTDREAYDVIVALAANDMLKGVPRPGRLANRRSAFGAEPENICSLRDLPVLTDTVEKVLIFGEQ